MSHSLANRRPDPPPAKDHGSFYRDTCVIAVVWNRARRVAGGCPCWAWGGQGEHGAGRPQVASSLQTTASVSPWLRPHFSPGRHLVLPNGAQRQINKREMSVSEAARQKASSAPGRLSRLSRASLPGTRHRLHLQRGRGSLSRSRSLLWPAPCVSD